MTAAVTGVVAAVVLAASVLVWPDDDPRPRTGEEEPAVGEPGAATVEEAAAALGLVAAALRSGVGAVEALEAVARVDPGPAGRELAVVAAAHRWGQPPEVAWAHVGPGWVAAAVAWHAAHAAGAAPSALLDAAAVRIRAEESRRVETSVQRAGVLLVLPLGACFLPGFLATTVTPVVLHLLGGLAW